MSRWTYFDSIADRQEDLEQIVRRHAIHVVGNGYIDIIVTPDRCFDFINDLTTAGFMIEAVSWWCHATDENKRTRGCPHGYGGPMTEIGWFCEMSHVFDQLSEVELAEFDAQVTHAELCRLNVRTAELIKNKQIGPLEDDRYLNLAPDGCLTPGIWVRVPDGWTR